jgi:hypothetical protein
VVASVAFESEYLVVWEVYIQKWFLNHRLLNWDKLSCSHAPSGYFIENIKGIELVLISAGR